MNFDIIIKNGTIIDGTNKPSFKSDIGIIKDKISKIGTLNNSNAKKIINANGDIYKLSINNPTSDSTLIFFLKRE